MTSFALVFGLVGLLGTAWGVWALRRGLDRRRSVIVLTTSLAISAVLHGSSGPQSTAPAVGSPGHARVCLTDPTVDLAGDAIDLPATTVLEDAGALQGSRNDPASWTETPSVQKAAIITLAPVRLTQAERCADVAVEMLVTPLADSTSQHASENHVFTIADVLDYPIPAQKPVVEFGKLVDDVAIKAILLSDVTASVTQTVAQHDETADSQTCLAGAQKLAAFLKGGVGRQTSEVVFLAGIPAEDASYECPRYGRTAADLFVAWEGQARPPSATLDVIAVGGAYLTGATPAEVASETTACVSAAVKPDADEAANREFRGVKIECRAYARDGGGGSVTIYRRFGTAPARPELSSDSQTAMEQVSAAAKVEDERKAAEALSSAKWWLDPSVPLEVKSFALRTARKIALAERCPAEAPSTAVVREEAIEAGVAPADLQPGGRYFALLINMINGMRRETAKESVEAACQAAKGHR